MRNHPTFKSWQLIKRILKTLHTPQTCLWTTYICELPVCSLDIRIVLYAQVLYSVASVHTKLLRYPVGREFPVTHSQQGLEAW